MKFSYKFGVRELMFEGTIEEFHDVFNSFVLKYTVLSQRKEKEQ